MPKPSSYDQFKEFQGKRYTGMKVGRKHRWKYDAGDWIEKKITPDKWEFNYAVVKRRAGKAPEGSGAPVGTAYRWYILASQVVTKADANSYTTEMVGVKFKLAHKRADKESWSASEKAQRKALAKVLREMLVELEETPVEAAAAQAGNGKAGNGRAGGKAADGGATKPKVRATRDAHPIPQARKRGTAQHHPRASGAPRRTTRSTRSTRSA